MIKSGIALVITSKYHADILNPYLTNDLVNELSEHLEKVIVVGYGEESKTTNNGNIEEHIINLNSKIKFLKYFLVWPLLFFKVFSVLFREKNINHLIMFAPLSVLWPAAFVTRFFKIKKKTAIVFDLFPIHQVQIGSIPKYLAGAAKVFERYLLSGFSHVTAMGTNNKKQIENYYSTQTFNAEVIVVPLWSPKVNFTKKFYFKSDVIKLVFGGQIIKGREIDTMIEHLKKLKAKGLNISLDVYSKGAGFEFLKEKYCELDWLSFKAQIPRDEYFSVLTQYDVGLIVTDRRVTLPTFPSKILDYSRAGLASYCLVESESDLFDISTKVNVIHLNFFNFSNEGLERSFSFFKKLKLISDADFESEFNVVNEYISIDAAVYKLLQ